MENLGEIKTQEQATQRVELYVGRAVAARKLADVRFPDPEKTRKHQETCYQNWLMNYGAAVGALTVLHDSRLIPDNAFRTLQQVVFNTLAPTVVGDVGFGIQRR